MQLLPVKVVLELIQQMRLLAAPGRPRERPTGEGRGGEGKGERY